MKLTPEFVVMLVVQIFSIGMFVGGLKMTLKYIEERFAGLEKKQDKHNNLIERMCNVEQSCKSAHKRIDGVSRHEQ